MNTIATITAGKPYGHVPGHSFHDVTAEISRPGYGGFRVRLEERSGSNQGSYDQVHYRSEVIAHAGDLETAIERANANGRDAGMPLPYLVEALSLAADEARALADQ